MDDFAYREDALYCERAAAADLAERFGTPLYVYSRATIVDHFRKLERAFEQLDPLICFSLKSCGNIHIARVLSELGAGMDVVSGGELHRALLAGTRPRDIVFAGVGKTDLEICEALTCDDGPIGWFNIESEAEFENIARLARELGVKAHGALRINPDVDPRTHRYTTTGKRETKFGVDLDRARAFFDTYGDDPNLRLDALHTHLGSPIYSPEPYVEAIDKTLVLMEELAGAGRATRTLDLGGGFGADYESGRSPDAAAYAERIVPLLLSHVRQGLRIILEPGRSIMANAGVLLTRVQYIKSSGDRQFVVCDAGMHTLIRPVLYEGFHFVWPARVRIDHLPPLRGASLDLPSLVTCDVVGPICESSDFLARDRRLPPVARGDVLCVFAAGAYGMSMASQYNAHPRPAEVLVDGADARIIRRRETYDDLVRHELPAPAMGAD
jgi:diaminopimelate decarboxylase